MNSPDTIPNSRFTLQLRGFAMPESVREFLGFISVMLYVVLVLVWAAKGTKKSNGVAVGRLIVGGGLLVLILLILIYTSSGL